MTDIANWKKIRNMTPDEAVEAGIACNSEVDGVDIYIRTSTPIDCDICGQPSSHLHRSWCAYSGQRIQMGVARAGRWERISNTLERWLDAVRNHL